MAFLVMLSIMALVFCAATVVVALLASGALTLWKLTVLNKGKSRLN